jgi:hypothetical protein
MKYFAAWWKENLHKYWLLGLWTYKEMVTCYVLISYDNKNLEQIALDTDAPLNPLTHNNSEEKHQARQW